MRRARDRASDAGCGARILRGERAMISKRTLLTAMLLAGATPAMADSAAAAGESADAPGTSATATGATPTLKTIEVTARKKSEQLQHVPMTVIALDAEDQRKLGIDNLADVAEYV